MIVEVLFNYVYNKLFLYQLFATLVTYASINIAVFVKNRRKRYQLFKYYGIPGPEPCLLDGNLSDYRHTDEPAFKVDKRFGKIYGKYFGVFIGDEPKLIITDLDILKKIFFEESASFTERSHIFIESPITKGILFARYPRWKVMRKVMSPSFSMYNMRGSSSSQFIEDSIKLMIHYIDQKQDEAKANNGKSNIDIHALMKSTALHLISTMAIKLPNIQVKENEEYVKSLDDFLSSSDKGIVIQAIKFPFLKSILQFLANHFEYNKAMTLIHRTLDKIIDESLFRLLNKSQDKSVLYSYEQPQVIDTLIKLHHVGKLTRDEVIGNAQAILFAGYDTTSTTLTYVFWVLGKYPEIQDLLREELLAHGVESKYLMKVINETMRLYPTVTAFTSRVTTQTVNINELIIPQGTKVVYNTWLMHRNPDLWTNPYNFDPERFQEGANINPCAFAPFGLGERRCLGYQLALLEMKMIICDILIRYKLKLQSPQNLELVQYASILTKPKDKVLIELESIRQ